MSELRQVPIKFIEERGRGTFGRFRYPVFHLTEFDNKPAINRGLLTDETEVKSGVITIPDSTVEGIGRVANWLSFGVSQEGLYTGRNSVTNNCARFVHDIHGIDFDRLLLDDSSHYAGWTIQPYQQEQVPSVGEVIVYTRDHARSWAHWAMGVESNIGDVIGLGGPNGHAISIAHNNDVAKALGHTTPNTATHHSK